MMTFIKHSLGKNNYHQQKKEYDIYPKKDYDIRQISLKKGATKSPLFQNTSISLERFT